MKWAYRFAHVRSAMKYPQADGGRRRSGDHSEEQPMRISMVATLRLSARRALAPTGLEPVASSRSAKARSFTRGPAFEYFRETWRYMH